MTREDQIRQEAYYYAVTRSHVNPDYEEIEWGFQSGAEWADANPNWHKYPDEKPPKNTDEVSKVVFVQTKKGLCPIKAHMFYEQRKNEYEIICVEHWYSPELKYNLLNDEIIAWMELPQPPKFD